MIALLAAFAALLQAAPPQPTHPAIRDPAYGPDGRLVVSIDGDLWIQEVGGRTAPWSRLTSGLAWDREPSWAPDGGSVVFVSDREGSTSLWRIRLPASDGGPAERLTRDPGPDREPSVGRDGTIVFTRGVAGRGRIWVRAADGTERRLTTSELPERWPALSPDGARVAYVQTSDQGRRLRVRPLTGTAGDSILVGDRVAERPAWAPSADRIAFASPAPRPGTYVAAADGRYVNLVSQRHGSPAWSAEGATIAIAEESSDEQGYNGDPIRVADRAVTERLASVDRLVFVNAPVPPDASLGEAVAPAAADRATRNSEAFDRVWTRIDTLYFSRGEGSARRADWQRLREIHRPRAVAAASDLALERELFAMLRDRPTYRTEAAGRAVVSSAHPVATAAGLEIMQKGGNVVDAAAAVSFALGVVEPDASGVGGYGEMLIQLKGMERPTLVEFMARVPEEATLSNASLLQDGRYPSDGPVLAMVPGTVAGMHAAWKKLGSGKVPWADVVAPAIRAARDGYLVSDGLATTLMLERDRFAKYDGSRALFFRDGKPRIAGDTIRNPDLAWTLERIAKDGADGFYKGEVARRLVNDLRGRGNAIRLTDLARYFAPERDPVSFTYRGNAVFSSAPPAQGGALLAGQLNNLEQVTGLKPYPEDAGALHAMISAWQLAPSSRNRIADPSLWPVTTEPFTSKDTSRVRWRCFDPSKALTPDAFRGDTLRCGNASAKPLGNIEGARSSGGELPDVEGTAFRAAPRDECAGLDHAEGSTCRPQGTTAFTVADADGNMVAVTQTLGTWGGNFYVTPGLGFLYNDKLTSYSTDPNGYGARLPYARHGSTLAPTIVFRGTGPAKRPWIALGAAGNAWITSAVYQSLVGMTDLGLGPQRALELPRFLPGQRGAPGHRQMVIDIEDGMSPDVVHALRAIGYHFDVISLKGELRMGYGAAAMIDGKVVRAGGDPRRGGTAGAIK